MKKVTAAGAMVLTLIGFVGVGAVFAAPEAYIDPNTGGMIFQALLVVFTAISGILFFFSSRIKMGFNRLMRSFRERKGEEMTEAEAVVDELIEESQPEETISS